MTLIRNLLLTDDLTPSFLGINKVQLNASFPTASTALVNITQGGDSLAFAVAANEKFTYQALLRITSNSNLGCRIAFTFPAAGFLMASVFSSAASATAFRVDDLTTSGTEGATLVTFVGPGLISVGGSYINGANAGTVQMQIRSLNAAQTITVGRGSYLQSNKF